MPQQPDPRKQPRDPRGSDPREFTMDTRRNSGNRRATPPKGAPANSQDDARGRRVPPREGEERRRESGREGARPIPVRGQNPRQKPPQGGTTPRRAPRADSDDTARFDAPRPSGAPRPVRPRPARPDANDQRAAGRPQRPRRPGEVVGNRDGERRIVNERHEGRRGADARFDDVQFDETSGAYVNRPTGGPSSQRPLGRQKPQGPRGPQRGVRPVPTRPATKPDGASPVGDDGGTGSGDGTGKKKRRFGRGKKILAGFLVLVLLWFAGLIWAGTSAWDKVAKVDAMPAHTASKGSGTNILLVGSDGREGLTNEQKRKLGTGSAEGQRTDSIMVLHIGGPKPTLMSIPRDSYVAIPGYGKNKINAAFSIGGPKLLIKTIEQDTGIYINNYMEIGFGGFASVVDAVGGVRICVAFDMDDKKAHINLKKGCQTLNGANALGYVRARYSDPEGDIGRAKRQRQFLGALMKKISSPTNLLFPWKLKGLGESGAQGLTVDKDMGMVTAARSMWTLKGFSSNNGNSVVVPLDNTALYTPVGEAVEWDPTKSAELFKAIRENGDTAPFIVKKPGTTSN